MTYKNKTDQRLEIPGVGVVEPNGTIETDKVLENQNLELVQDNKPQAPAQPAQTTTTPAAPAAPAQPNGGTK